MGVQKNVNYDSFPEQGDLLNCRVRVCFNYDTSRFASGEIVRDDSCEPFLTIIKLDDNRHVLSTECMYHVIEDVDEFPDIII